MAAILHLLYGSHLELLKMAANQNRKCDVLGIFWGVLFIAGAEKLQNIEDLSLVILGYQLLPLATSKLMGDSKEFNDSAIFWGVLLIVSGGKLQKIEDSSLVILGYQLLPLATSKLMGDNKEFNDSAIFCGILLNVSGENFRRLKIHHSWSLVTNCCPWQPVNNWVIIRNLMIHPYFELFYSLLVLENFRRLKIHHWWSLVTNCCP